MVRGDLGEQTVRLDAAPFQVCSEPPDNSMIIRGTSTMATGYLWRGDDGLVLDMYLDVNSSMDLIGDAQEDYTLNQPYEVAWSPELYWPDWDNPLDLQSEHTRVFGSFDAALPQFPYFDFQSWLTGSERDPAEIFYISWWNERTFVPYTLCVSRFRPDRLSMVLTIDPTGSDSIKSKQIPFPVTIVVDWSDNVSAFSGSYVVDNNYDSGSGFHTGNYFFMDYSHVTEADVWGDLVDTGAGGDG